MASFLKTTLARRFVSIVPGLVILGLMLFIVFSRVESPPDALGTLPGKSLAAFDDLYPLRADAAGDLMLDVAKFSKALKELDQRQSPRAIADLIYLGQANNVTLLLSDNDKAIYGAFVRNHSYAEDNAQRYIDQHFQPYKDIVHGLGKTFAGTGIEIVLHDMRNPLKTILAIENSISGRRIGDPTTVFGLQMIKTYAIVEQGQSSLISYGLKLKDGRDVKSTTIPIYDPRNGVIGAICINVDISKLDMKNYPQDVDNFINLFKAINPNEKVTEMIDNSLKFDTKQ